MTRIEKSLLCTTVPFILDNPCPEQLGLTTSAAHHAHCRPSPSPATQDDQQCARLPIILPPTPSPAANLMPLQPQTPDPNGSQHGLGNAWG